MTNVEKFDAAMQKVTDDRGDVYGHPLDDFARVSKVKEAVATCQDDEVRHCLEMIGVKLARLTETPDHMDSVIDIGGYARCIAMILDERVVRGEKFHTTVENWRDMWGRVYPKDEDGEVTFHDRTAQDICEHDMVRDMCLKCV
jgi:hypothetical protein